MAKSAPRSEFSAGEKGYSWLHFSVRWRSLVRLVVTLVGIGVAAGFYYWYVQVSSDAAPDSAAGYGYAVLGTICLLLAGMLYSWRRRSHKRRSVGQLHAALHWHMCFAVLGLALLLMHSFGNFNLRSGTYALYGLIALVVSGFVGRLLDRVLPRLIAGEVHRAVNAEGEDRIETISQKIEALVVHNAEVVGPRSVVPMQSKRRNPVTMLPHTPWDLAYISLEATPQELNGNAPHYRFVPEKKSGLTRPGALMPGAQEQIAALQGVQRALQREQLLRYVIRYWRGFHVLLALVTLGLVVWHVVYAMGLLLPTLLHN